MRALQSGLGVRRLLILGGSETNAVFLADDLVDELFLTIAPKVKLGRSVPTYAGGEPLARDSLLRFKLLEHHVVESEVFLRYRREGVGE
jgi:riboflavin biosynthesis pyrimidine reductase